MAEHQTFEYDVLVIGAGGAGLRAAIAASAAGVSVGVICKSLLGKAHTVMAEGGIAAALANVDDRDSWRVHFADTMRGGQYVNNYRMAELHAQEAPECVRELEGWGALFDRTADGRILQRNFGGHRYPRLVHVGDRTGLEMIRTLQDHGVHQGISVHMECTVIRLLKDGERVVGAVAYERERGRVQVFRARAVVLATGGVGRAFKITSNSWEYTGDGHTLAYDAGAELIDMEYLQFQPTGMVWPPSVRGILVTEGVRGEGGVLLNKEGRRFMFDDIPANYTSQTADNEEEGWRYTQGDKNARRPPELLTRDHVARAIVREIKEGRGSPHGGVFLDIAWIGKRLPKHDEHIKRKLPSRYHQFMQLAGIDITTTPMEVGPTTHYMMGGVRVHPDTQMPLFPDYSRRENARPVCTAPIGWAGIRCLTCWYLANVQVTMPPNTRAARVAATWTRTRSNRRHAGPLPRSSRAPAPWVPSKSSTRCRKRCRIWSALCAGKTRWQTPFWVWSNCVRVRVKCR
jgi:succinate dehydrogenase / fumarate reductase flavoprotein subunit